MSTTNNKYLGRLKSKEEHWDFKLLNEDLHIAGDPKKVEELFTILAASMKRYKQLLGHSNMDEIRSSLHTMYFSMMKNGEVVDDVEGADIHLDSFKRAMDLLNLLYNIHLCGDDFLDRLYKVYKAA